MNRVNRLLSCIFAIAASAMIAQQASAVPVPAAGLLYHLDADTGITLNGANVAQWNDTSGNANHFAQGSIPKQPLFVASSPNFNGRAVIAFDGDESGSAGNPLVAPNADELILGNATNNRTVIIVNRITANTGGGDGLWGQNNADKGIRHSGGTWSHPGNGDDFSNGGTFAINGVAGNAPGLNVSHIATAVKNVNLAFPQTSIGDYFQVGANAARSYAGQVGEVIVYNRALTAQETHQIEGALGLKYGIAVRPSTVLGALRGGDLTDPENDGSDAVAGGANFNAIFTSNNEPGFDPGNGGGEKSFNVFDNKEGPSGGENKWCCDVASVGSPLQITAQIIAGRHDLTSFTLTSSNDSPERDPLNFQIQGSNDGVLFDTIFAYNNAFGNLFTARDQTLLFEAGVNYAPPALAYSFFRYLVTGTGGGNHALAEIEYFGTIQVPEPASLGLLGLGAMALLARRRKNVAA